MATYLGPLSAISGGRRQFYVDMSNQLDTNEKLFQITSPVSSNTGLVVTGESILTQNILTRDGHYLYSGEAISFWATASGDLNFLATVTTYYTTTLGSSDATLVYLKVEPVI